MHPPQRYCFETLVIEAGGQLGFVEYKPSGGDPAVDYAALDEAEHRAKLIARLRNWTPEAVPPELQVKCLTFTPEARGRDMVSVEKSLFAQLREDKARLDWLAVNTGQVREAIDAARKAGAL